jgi:hypothetical protein
MEAGGSGKKAERSLELKKYEEYRGEYDGSAAIARSPGVDLHLSDTPARG